MQSVTPQRTSETTFPKNPPKVADDAIPQHLRYGCLSPPDYDELLLRWVNFVDWHVDKRRPYSRVFRQAFVDRLKSKRPELKEVMLRGVVKLPQEAQCQIVERFTDPLAYLTACDVPPLEILDVLDDTKLRLVEIKRVAREVIEIEKQIARGKKQDGDYLASLQRSIGLPPKQNPKAKRRAPIDNEFKFAVNQLVAVIYGRMTSMTLDEWRKWRNRRTVRDYWPRTILPAVTGVMLAAWPEWFRSKLPETCLRKVKACWPKKAKNRRRRIKILISNYPNSIRTRNAVTSISGMIDHEPPVR